MLCPTCLSENGYSKGEKGLQTFLEFYNQHNRHFLLYSKVSTLSLTDRREKISGETRIAVEPTIRL